MPNNQTFKYYVDRAYNTATGDKRAFCIEDTNRYHNDESTPSHRWQAASRQPADRNRKQVLRVCEVSQMLGVGIPCTYLNSASNTIVDGDSETVTFSCPGVRDATAARAGRYALPNASLQPAPQNPSSARNTEPGPGDMGDRSYRTHK